MKTSLGNILKSCLEGGKKGKEGGREEGGYREGGREGKERMGTNKAGTGKQTKATKKGKK